MLITYPVEIERLDIYNQFLLPCRRHAKATQDDRNH